MGAGAAVEFLASLATSGTRRDRLGRAFAALHARGQALLGRLWQGLGGIDGVRLYGPPPERPRTPTVGFTLRGRTTDEVASVFVPRASHGVKSPGSLTQTSRRSTCSIRPSGVDVLISCPR